MITKVAWVTHVFILFRSILDGNLVARGVNGPAEVLGVEEEIAYTVE